MNPLNLVPAAIISGVVLAIIVFVIIPGSGFNELSLARWVHILSGIMWIGLLYYGNVAQIPALAASATDKGGPGGAGITKYVAPRVLRGAATIGRGHHRGAGAAACPSTNLTGRPFLPRYRRHHHHDAAEEDRALCCSA